MKTRNSSLTVAAIVLMLMLGAMVVTPSLNLRAQEPVFLYGWVFDDSNDNGVWDEPLESGLDGVQVDLHDVSSLDPVSADTFGGGYFEFEITQPSYYKVTIDSPGTELDPDKVFFGNETGIVRVHEDNVDMGHIGLKSRDVNATVRGAVTDGDTGDSVNGATVTLRDKMNDYEISVTTAPIHEYENRRDKWMISSPIALSDTLPIRLRFRHWYAMEVEDGGNLQISTNGGATWNVLTPFSGYPSSNVVDGQPGYTGTSGGQWKSVTTDLDAYADMTIQIAFRFTSDTTSVKEGWYIDDIYIEAGIETIWEDDVENENARGWTFQPENDPWQMSEYKSYSTSHSWYCGLDIEGWYSIDTYDGPYEIEVNHPDYSPTFETVIVSPNNIVGNLKNTGVVSGTESLYLNGNPISGADYSIDYASGTIDFLMTIDDTDIITADYQYATPIPDETLVLEALGSETSGQAAHGDIDIGSFDLYMDGTLLSSPADYTYVNFTGAVSYSVPLPAGSVVWANYTYGLGNPVVFDALTNTSKLDWEPLLGSLRIWINAIESFAFVYSANGEVWFTQSMNLSEPVNASYVALRTVTDEKVQLAGGTRADLELFTYKIFGRARKAVERTGITDRPIHVALYDSTNGRVVSSTVPSGPEFSIGAYPGTFYLIARIDGYKTVTLPMVTVVDTDVSVSDQFFEVSEEERIYTNITFPTDDWNVIDVETKWLANSESYFQGLDYSELHNARMQIDVALGNGDGFLDGTTEIPAFEAWLASKGPRYVVTDDFFLVDEDDFVSNHSSLQVSTTLSASTVDSPNPFSITTTARYNTSGIEAELDEYELVEFVQYDTDVFGETEKNYTYSIALPTQNGQRYELVENETVAGVEVRGFLTVRIDPPQGSGGPVAVDMTVHRSLNGTARIEVIDPLDRIFFLNTTLDNYTAVVPANLNITFSAESSTDPNSPTEKISPYANFTWIFDMSNPVQTTRYGIDPVYNYTVGREYGVSLTISESGLDPGGNISQNEATIIVDHADPVAQISINVTALDIGVENANDMTINVNESMAIKFDSEMSSDLRFGSEEGDILDWKWDLESDGTWDEFVKSFTHSYDQPGEYVINLTVADEVGHWSPNATVTFIVADITPPEARVMILNETFVPTTTATENKTFYFNASDSGDNYDELEDLSFAWDFGDGTVIPAQVGNLNVTHVFTRIDTFNVTLNVTDTAGNTGNTTLTVMVSPDGEARPDLRVLSETFYSEPESVEEGQRIKLYVNLTNKLNKATAQAVQVHFYLVDGDKEKEIGAGTLRFYNESGLIPGPLTLEAGEEVQAEIRWTPEVVGKLTIRVKVSDAMEHSTQIGAENQMTDFVTVSQAPWKTYLVYIVLIIVIILVIVIIYLRRKWQRGELTFRRKEKEPKEKKTKKVKK